MGGKHSHARAHQPTPAPTYDPTRMHFKKPSSAPTNSPGRLPTLKPAKSDVPTPAPTHGPTRLPTPTPLRLRFLFKTLLLLSYRRYLFLEGARGMGF